MPSLEEAIAMATPWWPLLAQVLLFWYLTNVGKKQFWTHEAAAKGGVMAFMRKTMSLHALVWGAVAGALYPHMPAVAAATTRGEAIMWGVTAGIVSMLGHKILKAQAKKRGWTGVLNVLSTVGDRPTSAPPPETSE